VLWPCIETGFFSLIGFCVLVLFLSDFSYWSRAADLVGQLGGQLLSYVNILVLGLKFIDCNRVLPFIVYKTWAT